MSIHNGMILVTPTSVNKTGTLSTATINTSGSVSFSFCETLSLNGVFSSVFDNYVIDMRGKDDGTTFLRLRIAGVDNVTASSYTTQLLDANSTVSGARFTENFARALYSNRDDPNGNTMYIYGPNLAQPTTGRSINTNSISSARIVDWAWTHNQSIPYDGFTILRTSTSVTMSGVIKVYGLRQ
jgi:hypothetical protein